MKSEDFALQEIDKMRRIADGEIIDPDSKPGPKCMISSEAPILLTKACELLIRDLSVRAWKHTDHNRRKTLQRSDVHAAVGESEVFDFLIDIVPRVVPNAAAALLGPPPAMPAMDAMNNVQNIPPPAAIGMNMVQPPQVNGVDPSMMNAGPADLGNFQLDDANAQASIPQIQQQWANEPAGGI